MKKTNKAFTIVELVIVIAVIAILAAVLIPTFSNLIEKANESKDTSLVKNINTALVMEEVNQSKNNTMSDALEDALTHGYTIEKLTPTSNGDIVWDEVNNRFALMKNDTLFYGTEETKELVSKGDLYKLWKITDDVEEVEQQKYSIYLSGKTYDKAVNVKVGFDAGLNTMIPSVTYKTDDIQSVSIRTNGGELYIDAKNSDVFHYEYSVLVNVKDVKSNSYHEFGEVGELVNEKGHIVAEPGSTIYILDIKDTAQTATIKKESNIISMSEGSIGKVDKPIDMDILTFDESNKPTQTNHAHKFGSNHTQYDIIYHTCKICGYKEKADEQLYKELGDNKSYVARVGDNVFEKIDEAIVAANIINDNEIKVLKLLKDISYDNTYKPSENNYTIKENQKIILDLNGQTWQPITTYYSLVNAGNLTIIGEGKILSYEGETGSSLIRNIGTLKIESGTFESHGSTVIKNEPGSTTIINGGVFKQLNGKKYETGSPENLMSYKAYYMLTMMNYGSTTINNGIFMSASPYCINNNKASTGEMGVLHINGGEFSATGSSASAIKISDYNMDISISGGKFNNSVSLARLDVTKLTGGTFIIDSSSNLVNRDISNWTDRYAVYNMEEGILSITNTKPTENLSAKVSRNGNENIFFIGKGGSNKMIEFCSIDGLALLKAYETPTNLIKFGTYSKIQIEYINCAPGLKYDLLDKDTEMKISNEGNVYTYFTEPIIENAVYYVERDGKIIKYFTERDNSNIYSLLQEGDILKLNKDYDKYVSLLANVINNAKYDFIFDLNGHNINVNNNFGLLISNSSNNNYNNCDINVKIINSKDDGGVISSNYYIARIYAFMTEGHSINISFDNIKFITTKESKTSFIDDASKNVATYSFNNCTFTFNGEEYTVVENTEGNPTFQKLN